MALTFTVSTLPSSQTLPWRLLLIIVLAMLLAACGMVDYDIHEENLFASSKKNKDLGTITFHYADGSEPYSVHIRRVQGGYAMQAPLVEDADGSNIRFVASHTKAEKYFVGLESRLTF